MSLWADVGLRASRVESTIPASKPTAEAPRVKVPAALAVPVYTTVC